ncbi:zinc-dependent alcohol dehydrogenase family protein [Novosphingobium beihaiensis]|uniref:Zinc-dependent alcohol dehydrogenase family protein n=1 Tax=Novosphingobium beihaiensis TaxID=2930389 RepID=A0ABT0BTQ8_9SPHN|nr:zinc-dependent alcohol dehydrogenase family protein [Novosphingobium beihaiensis]MCJ2188443.1 zinc-dependent alcohol dehydrogenase family protein [Novosphingobium beihaiensis]
MPETARIVRFHAFGDADVLQLETASLAAPGKGEVRLQVRAMGVNRADVLFRQGKYVWTPQLPARIGVEAAGIVDAVGPGGDAAWIGKRVLCIPAFSPNEYGVYGDAALVPETCIAEFPASLSFEQAASCLVQYLTAWGALIHFGKVRKGDFVLLTAASSSTGMAAIQMVKAAGGISIAVTRSPAKKQALLDAGADHVVVTEAGDLAGEVMAITGGAGARIIYDPVAGDTLEALVACAAKGATLFAYGILSDQPTVLPMLDAFRKYLTIKVYDVHEVIEDRTLLEQGLDYLFTAFESGALVPVISRTFPLEEIVAAHRYMEAGHQVGKVVVTAGK